MKAIASIDQDNWLNVTVTAETPQEAAQMVQLGLARNADTSRVTDFCLAQDRGVECSITLKPRRDMYRGSIKPYSIPKV